MFAEVRTLILWNGCGSSKTCMYHAPTGPSLYFGYTSTKLHALTLVRVWVPREIGRGKGSKREGM